MAYESLLVEQMTKLKETEALIKRQLKTFSDQLNKIWKMQDQIIEAVKAEVDKEEANGK